MGIFISFAICLIGYGIMQICKPKKSENTKRNEYKAKAGWHNDIDKFYKIKMEVELDAKEHPEKYDNGDPSDVQLNIGDEVNRRCDANMLWNRDIISHPNKRY